MKILFLYNHSHIFSVAQTIKDHIYCFRKYSKNTFYYMDPHFGLPAKLDMDSFDVIVLHYSIYTPLNLFFHQDDMRKVRSSKAHKVLFIQDEYRQVLKARDFINFLEIDTIYTLADSNCKNLIYPPTEICSKQLISCLPGYLNPGLKKKLSRSLLPQESREIDIGYRGRPLPHWLGEFGQRKSLIGDFFKNISKKEDLKINIQTAEAERIYGKKWYSFLESCKATLGVEGGSGLIDFKGDIQEACDSYLERFPNADFDTVEKEVLCNYEQKPIYRAISPRVFEAAMTKTCQILTRGDYSGVIEPDIHYIPIEPDFSDYKEALSKFRDLSFRNQIIEKAHTDLCLNDTWSYKSFVKDFDEHLDESVYSSAKPKNLKLKFFVVRNFISTTANEIQDQIIFPKVYSPIILRVKSNSSTNNVYQKYKKTLKKYLSLR